MTHDGARGEDVEAFLRSMPSPYDAIFAHEDVAKHHEIVSARGERLAHVALWRELNGGVVAVCVVADDQPGLLSLVTAAFAAHRLDVTSAQIFCRMRADGVEEAVDFFWLRSADRVRVLLPADVAQVSETLIQLLLDDQVARATRPTTVAGGPLADTRVYFDVKALQRGESVLVVETRDTAGLLFAITSELYRRAVEISASDIRTHGSVALDRFTLTDEAGRSLSGQRLVEVQQGVRAAVKALLSNSPRKPGEPVC